MMEAASTSETSANFYQTVRRNNPEDSHLHTRRRKNPKSQIFSRIHVYFEKNYYHCLWNCLRGIVYGSYRTVATSKIIITNTHKHVI
jgi:hypothetical protein